MFNPARIIGLRRARVAGLFLGLYCVAAPAFAANEQVTAHQSLDGQVHVTLTGMVDGCNPMFGGFNGPPSGSVVGNQVLISSLGYGGECAPPPPNQPPNPPSPYTQKITFGVLPPGTYDIEWQITLPWMQPIVTTTQFNVLAAPLQTPVPLPANRFGLGLMLGVLGVGVLFLRRAGR